MTIINKREMRSYIPTPTHDWPLVICATFADGDGEATTETNDLYKLKYIQLTLTGRTLVSQR